MSLQYVRQKKKKEVDHSRQANKAYREVNLGCQDAFRPLPDRTLLLAVGSARQTALPCQARVQFSVHRSWRSESVKVVSDLAFVQVGALGFCMGGALSCLAAEHAGAAAAVAFYGTPDPALGHVRS